MQVVSGPIGRQKVHYEAPPAAASGAQADSRLAYSSVPNPDDRPGDLQALPIRAHHGRTGASRSLAILIHFDMMIII